MCTILHMAAYNFNEELYKNCILEEFVMCRADLRKVVGSCIVCFGAGILFSFLLPPYFLAFIEAAVVVTSGVLLLGKHK